MASPPGTPEPNFEEEYEVQKAEVIIFNDVIGARSNLDQCRKDIASSRQIMADHPPKIQKLELEFLLASTDLNEWKKSHKTHSDLWMSKNVRMEDIVFGSYDDAGPGLSIEKLEAIISLANLNIVLLEEQLQLKTLPALKGQKKAELSVLKQAYDDARRTFPELEAKEVDLECECRAAEQRWRERWIARKKRASAPANQTLINFLEERCRHQNARIGILEKEIHILRGAEEKAEQTRRSQLIDENGGPGPDVGNKTPMLPGTERNTLERPGTGVNRFTLEKRPEKPTSVHGPGRESKSIPPASMTMKYGSAITDAEYIKDGQGGEKKTDWYIENYGKSPDFAWKVLRCSSKRYLDILDWHSAMKQLLSLSSFDRSDFKKRFDDVFKETLFWTLGWGSENWVVPQAMSDFIDSEEKGQTLYRSLEADFNAAHVIHQ